MIFLAKKFVLSMIIRIFAATESATLPIRTANQGGSFAFYEYIKKALSIIHRAISVRVGRGSPTLFYTSFQSTNPFPISSSSIASAITLRLSALNGSVYCLAFICSDAASTPPLLLSFSSRT